MDKREAPSRRVFLLTCVAPITAAVVPPFAEGAQKAAPPRRRRRGRTLARQVGFATFYSGEFHGEETASGRRYDQNALTAAHPKWPFGTVVRVTELESGRSVVVTINDRGPYGRNRREGTIIDLSRAAARKLDMVEDGQTRVRLDVLRWGSKGAAAASSAGR